LHPAANEPLLLAHNAPPLQVDSEVVAKVLNKLMATHRGLCRWPQWVDVRAHR
jgi:hypothetical protein